MTNPSPERWARIEEALDAALDRLDEDRVALLDELCGDDDELRREVSRLLVSIDRAGSSFERPPVEMVHEAAATAGKDQLEPGRVVGAYRVVELLGRGGMGAVYLAERADGAFDRQVALKIVKRGMDSEEILRRFRRERQILARLEHPNIAGLLDGGITDDGVPYFVMELARGQPIDDWCDAHGLTVEQRIRLFLPVCDAVRHAHRSLIVHRDLKPSNIVVVDGQPKLLDFGIAKMLSAEDGEDAQATRLEERRLTPEYAAPEQVRGEPTTTATDVYALGVILYELLTGRPPYRVQGGFAEVERVICTVEPRAPSSVAARDEIHGSAGEDALTLASQRAVRPEGLRAVLHGDLDAIVLKALAKESERRYPSINALMEDLRRYLHGHPVEARPTTRWYHFAKFVSRNRTAVGLASAAALALVVGSALALWQANRAELESQQRLVEAERAAAARDFLVQTFGEFDPDRLGGQRTFSHDDLIQKSLQNLTAFDEQPELHAVMANTVGDLFFKLGDASRADSLFHVALEILEPLGDHPDLSVTLNGLGEVARRERRLDEAVELFRRALTIRRATLPPDDPRIAQSVGSLATALYNQGGISSQAVAESLYMEVLALGAGVPSETVGAVLEGLGDLSLVQARHASQALREDSARIYYARARERYTESIDRRHTTVSTPTPDVARAMWGLAEAQEELGETEQALQVHRQSLGILRKVYGDQHPDVGLAEYRLGSALVRNATYDEAISVLSNAIRHLESAFGADFPSLLYARDALGRALAEKGRYHEAVVHLEIAVTQYARIAQTTSALTLARDFQTTELFLARAYNEVGRSEEAIRVLRRSFQRWSVEHDRIELAIPIAVELADLFARLGQPDSAAVYRSRADLSRRAGT